MRSRRQRRQPVILGLLGLALGLWSGAGVRAQGDEELLLAPRPTVKIQKLDRAPKLEEFLDMRPPEDLAPQLLHVTGFVQRNPEDGQPASQKTDVYVGYDKRNLYVVFVAFDDQPDLVRANWSRRENVFLDETVEVMLDTFHDQRRAFAFLTNPYGIQWDAQWTEGQGFDGAWDTVWRSRGQRTDEGFVVWMSIPFKSLRFTPEPDQTWGLIFVRDIQRNNETSFWPRVSNRIEGRLNQAATLEGFRDISPGRNIQLIPYGTARASRALDVDADAFDSQNDFDAGADAKFVIKDRMALDLTVNPDFSQVESDLPQVTANQRFEVFFPERRPFFLENADYFQTPFNLLFTRRIDEPRVGARLTGKTGRSALGALIIDDETPGNEAASGSEGDGEVAVNGIVRLNRDVLAQSSIGLMVTGREFAGRENRVAAVDGRFKLDPNWFTQFQYAYSSTDDDGDPNTGASASEQSDAAFQVSLNREGRKLNWHLHYVDIGEDFRTDLGFVPRTDIRDLHQRLSYDFRPEGPSLVSWEPRIYTQIIEDQDGTRLDWSVNPEIEFEFRRQTRIELFFEYGRERLRPKDLDQPELAPADGLDFERHRSGAVFRTRFIEAVQGFVRVFVGQGVNFNPVDGENPASADEFGSTLELTLRPTKRLRIDNTWLVSQLEDPDSGSRIFINQILRSRFAYQFDRRLTLRVILQYESLRSDAAFTTLESERNFNGDVLFTYLINPFTAIYLGYNGNYRTDDDIRMTSFGSDGDLVNDSQELFAKVNYLFRF